MSDIFAALFVGAASLFGSHALSKDSSKEERIRQAKVLIRGMIQKVTDGHPGFLFTVHEEVSAELKSLGNAIFDDLSESQQMAFGNACAAFVNSTDKEVVPLVTPAPFEGQRSPEDQAREDANWKKPVALLTARLGDVLETLGGRLS